MTVEADEFPELTGVQSIQKASTVARCDGASSGQCLPDPMRNMPPGIQIMLGGADGCSRSTDATTVSPTGFSREARLTLLEDYCGYKWLEVTSD
jgi:hypothetical protein